MSTKEAASSSTTAGGGGGGGGTNTSNTTVLDVVSGNSTSNNNDNGKRERPEATEDDEDTSEAPNKIMKSSDDSDEKESSSSLGELGKGRADTTNANNGTNEKASDGPVDTIAGSQTVAVDANPAGSQQQSNDKSLSAQQPEQDAVNSDTIQIDRTGLTGNQQQQQQKQQEETQNINNNNNSTAATESGAPAPTTITTATNTTPAINNSEPMASAATAPMNPVPTTTGNNNPVGGGAGNSDANNPGGTGTNLSAPTNTANTNTAAAPNAVEQDPNAMIEERGTVTAVYVGRVIGKGGEMIRDLQARSGARIDVDQSVPVGQPRVITYRGTRDKIDFAKRLVQMLVEGVHENDLPLGQASQEILIIPSQTVGKVIGRGGEMIRELQSRSHGKIQIDHTGSSGVPADQKQVTITGTQDDVTKAKEMVLFLVANPLMDAQQALNMLIDDKIRGGSKWGTGPPYMNLPNQGNNMSPQMLPPQFQQMSQGYGAGGGGYHQPPNQSYQYGGGGGGGAPYGGYQQQQPYQQQAFQQQASSAAAYAPSSFGARETDVMHAQKQFMGRIIGGKGVTINDLQKRSGCDIQINQDVPPGHDCEITIKGPRQGIEHAKAMVKDIIEIGPGHPYAGGMDSAYGSGATGGYHGAHPQGYGGGSGYAPAYGDQVASAGGGAGAGAYGQQYMPPAAGGAGGMYGQAAGGYGQAPAAAYTGAYPQQQPVLAGAPPPPPAATPSAWKTATSPDGQVYYYNEQTGETQWNKPAGMP